MDEVTLWMFSMDFGLVGDLADVGGFVLLVDNLIIQLFEVRLLIFLGNNGCFLLFIVKDGVIDDVFVSAFDGLHFLHMVLGTIFLHHYITNIIIWNHQYFHNSAPLNFLFHLFFYAFALNPNTFYIPQNYIIISFMQPNLPISKYLQENLLSALSFSHSGQFCALATKKDVKILVLKVKEINNIDSWELVQEMHEQTQTISQIDWAKDDKIISGSHDRSAFIYKRTGNSKWEKMLVNIDIKLSILCAKWAPSGKKFGLGASCRSLAVGFYNVESTCWTVSVREKFTKSPIISLTFHPSSNLLAVGSSDCSVKIVSCSFRRSKDPFVQKSDIQDSSYHGPFQGVDSLFDVLVSIDNVGGWVNHLSFELNGSFLLVLPHSNHFKVFDMIDEQNKIGLKEIDIKWNGLPFMSGFISDKGILYTGGFDRKVAAFIKSANGFNFNQFLEKNEKSSKSQIKKGIVSNMLSGIEKKTNIFGPGPSSAQHLNSIKIVPSPNRKFVVSYDVNGVIHFWE